MTDAPATLLVHCRFPTGAGNRVRVLLNDKVAGELREPIEVPPGRHRVRVTSWGLPLCGPLRVSCPEGAAVELALQVSLSGFLVGLVLYLLALAILAPLAVVLGQFLPGLEPLVVLATILMLVVVVLLDFYLLLPAFSLYTFRLVEKGCEYESA